MSTVEPRVAGLRVVCWEVDKPVNSKRSANASVRTGDVAEWSKALPC